ncbi:MAG TPA: sugar transferase [Polyangiales bacterium]|nr:sugar transferase [Polyangiales bacterium]
MARTRGTESGGSSSAERALGNLQLAIDVAIIIGSMAIAARLQWALRALMPSVRAMPQFHVYAALVYLVLPLWLILIATFRVHLAVPQRIGQAELLVRLIKLHVTGLAGLALLQFLTQSIINRSLVAIFLSCTFTLMYLQRSAWIAWARFQHARGTGQERVLLVGRPSRRMAELIKTALDRRDPPHFIGYLEAPISGNALSVPPPDAPTLPRVGTLADLARLLHEQPVDHVLFFPPTHRPESVRDELIACEEVGVTASFSVDLVQLAEATPHVTSHYDHAFVTFEVAPKRADALAIKYGLDPICAAFLIALLSPLLIAIALSIWLSMARPIVFVQERAGLHGRRFRMLKFRTMRVGAEDEQRARLDANEMSGPVFKRREDPRVTRLGKWLRRTSLDELPQLFNVLTGSMSLVGPRPLPVSEQAEIRGWQRRRLTMKPGITCLWQVSGRNDVDFVDWMLLDLKYIEEWSLWLDLIVLLKTIPVVLFGRGAR